MISTRGHHVGFVGVSVSFHGDIMGLERRYFEGVVTWERRVGM